MGTLFLTYRCNLQCPHCSVFERTANEMDTGSVIRLLTRLRQGGMTRIGITGGEPLLRQDVGEIIDHAAKIGLYVSIFTNGTLLKERFGEIGKASMVMTSLDGPPAIHNANRGEGSFEQTQEAIQHCVAHGMPVLGSAVLTRKNIDCVDDILDEARRLGIRMIFHPIHRYFASAGGYENLAADQEAYLSVFRLLRERKKQGAPILNSMAHIQYVLDQYPRNQRTCYAGKLHFAILPDGAITACPHIEKGHTLSDGSGPARLPEDLPLPSCEGCFCYPVVAQDFLFSLKPAEIANVLATIPR